MRVETQIPLLANRRTKIIATVGPASSDEAMLDALVAAGVDVFRLNMSHGTHADHAEAFARIRASAERAGRTVAVLADLCGPKVRVGEFAGGAIELTSGEEVVVTTRDVLGQPGLIPSQYELLAEDVVARDRILLDDGKLELEVLAVTGQDITCRVVTGGTLRNKKGMNLPGVEVSAPSLTDKDRSDARFAVELGVDFLALSFVRRAEDVRELRAFVAPLGDVAIIAKIEKPEALECAGAILDAADGIMIARGDLGVELAPEAVPGAQEQLIVLARKHDRPVIVATQMLESMIDSPRPTRAEATDVASAVRSGADAVMLSAETAAGRFPVGAVKMMDSIVRQTEGLLWAQGAYGQSPPAQVVGEAVPVADAVARATALLSRDLMVRAIVAVSRGSGSSVREIASARPSAPIIAICKRPEVRRRVVLVWGVVPFAGELDDGEEPAELARRVTRRLRIASPGQTVLVLRGHARDLINKSPTITVVTV